MTTSPFNLQIPRWFMSLRTILGWFMAVPSWRGRDGTRIPEFGLAVHISVSESVSESVGTAVLAGVGAIGDSIGAAGTRSTTTAGTTPGAGRSITGTPFTEVEGCAAEPTVSAVG